MKLFFLISYLTILFGCSSKTGLKPIFEIDGLFKPKDIGLDLGGFNNEVDRYFSVNIINNDSVPFNIYTNKDEKFYYPTSIQYTYIDETDGIRKSGRGISDFYSVKTTSIWAQLRFVPTNQVDFLMFSMTVFQRLDNTAALKK
ncbi:MAG TPA: hypothetical protein PKA00_20960 [Saprospiraceae bacterium]|nr:hypothetical protein [Saprospiraceae bacterium]